MSSRRRSRNRSIVGNLTDMQKRLKSLEARQAPTQLARKVVATQNIALRAVTPDVVDDGAIVRRTLAPQAVISTNLAVVGDPDGAAVATDNIQLEAVDTPQVADEAITNDKLAGDIEDDKLISISASKVGPDLLVDDQLEGISTDKLIGVVIDDQIDGVSTDKLIGSVLDEQIDSVSASKIGPDLLADDQIDGVSADKLIGLIVDTQIDSVDAASITVGLIQDEQIDGISGEKIIGGIDGELIVAQSIAGSDTLGAALSKFTPNSIGEDDIATDGVGFDELQFNSVAYAQIQENAVGELSIDSLAIARRHMQDNVIIARMINAGAVETAKIQNLAVTNAKIDNLTISGGKIAESTITSNKIFGGTNIITSVTDSAVGLTATTTSATYGRTVNITTSVGDGATQLALGNHTHAAGTVPSHTHPVNGTVTGSLSGSGSHVGHGAGNNGSHSHTISISENLTTGAPSSLKLKKEISDHQLVDIKNILNLKLKKYKYKNQLRHMHEGVNREWMHGYIAEEVLELGFEELLGYDAKGEPASLNYALLSTLVLELVKVQQTEIDSLKEEIQRLKEKI